MIRNFKLFEKFIEMRPINIGYRMSEGTIGIMLNFEYEEEIMSIIKYCREKNIGFRIFYEKNFLILIDKDSLNTVPFNPHSQRFYIPCEESKYGNGYEINLHYFYQDTLDEINWKEILIENHEDIKDVELLMNAKKYNL